MKCSYYCNKIYFIFIDEELKQNYFRGTSYRYKSGQNQKLVKETFTTKAKPCNYWTKINSKIKKQEPDIYIYFLEMVK